LLITLVVSLLEVYPSKLKVEGKGKPKNPENTWRTPQPTTKCILVKTAVLFVVFLHGYMATWQHESGDHP